MEPHVTRKLKNANVTRDFQEMALDALIKKLEKQLPTQMAMLISQLILQASSLYSPMAAQNSQYLSISRMMTNHPTNQPTLHVFYQSRLVGQLVVLYHTWSKMTPKDQCPRLPVLIVFCIISKIYQMSKALINMKKLLNLMLFILLPMPRSQLPPIGVCLETVSKGNNWRRNLYK